jgi:hypothetical protein
LLPPSAALRGSTGVPVAHAQASEKGEVFTCVVFEMWATPNLKSFRAKIQIIPSLATAQRTPLSARTAHHHAREIGSPRLHGGSSALEFLCLTGAHILSAVPLDSRDPSPPGEGRVAKRQPLNPVRTRRCVHTWMVRLILRMK